MHTRFFHHLLFIFRLLATDKPSLSRLALRQSLLCTIFVLLLGCSDKPQKLDPDLQALISQRLAEHALDAGTHYEFLPTNSLAAEKPEQIIVQEFFWYGCSHCYTAESLILHWKQALPTSAKIKRVPVVWQPIMEVHAIAYFVGEALLEDGLLTAEARQHLHETLFPVIMNLRSELREPKQLGRLQQHFAQFDIDEATFKQYVNKKFMLNAINDAATQQSLANISGTPSFVIGGIIKLQASAFANNDDLIKQGNRIIQTLAEILLEDQPET